MSKNRAAVLSVAALVLAAIALYWGYAAHTRRAEERAIAAAIQDTTARLRDALAVAPSSAGRRALGRIEEHAAAVEAHLKLVRSGAAGHPELSESAEHYVLGAREILRRQAASIRQSEHSAAGRAALIRHMRRAQRRDGSWIREAMLQKKAVEAQYFDYGLTLHALAELLKTFPDSRQRVAPHVDAKALLEPGPVEEARGMVLKESKRAAEELASIRRLR